jgi:hypothetical protein
MSSVYTVYTKIADLDLTREEKKSLRVLFTNKPLIRTEAEKIIPTCNDNEEVLDYLKELLKPGMYTSQKRIHIS